MQNADVNLSTAAIFVWGVTASNCRSVHPFWSVWNPSCQTGCVPAELLCEKTKCLQPVEPFFSKDFYTTLLSSGSFSSTSHLKHFILQHKLLVSEPFELDDGLTSLVEPLLDGPKWWCSEQFLLQVRYWILIGPQSTTWNNLSSSFKQNSPTFNGLSSEYHFLCLLKRTDTQK